MSEVHNPQSPVPTDREPGDLDDENRPNDPAANPPRSSAEHKRPRWGRFWTPIVLTILGVGLFAFALFLYPSEATEAPTPAYSRLLIGATFPVTDIVYDSYQISSVAAEIQVTAFASENTLLHLPAAKRIVVLIFSPPPGINFRNCSSPACTESGPYATWSARLTFNSSQSTTADFFVTAPSFGVADNGLTASAAIPDVVLQDPKESILLAGYQISDASSYDWSAFPTNRVSQSYALWQEALADGDTPGRAAVGINNARQSSDNNKTFFAGALLGLAGAAILSAVQETLNRIERLKADSSEQKSLTGARGESAS
jgi:hypothetical protein